jgi:hypothetical protein
MRSKGLAHGNANSAPNVMIPMPFRSKFKLHSTYQVGHDEAASRLQYRRL